MLHPRLLRTAVAIISIAPALLADAVRFNVPLPTPKSHYQTYNPDQATLELLSKVMNDLDPEMQQKVMDFMADPSQGVPDGTDFGQIQATIEKLGLRKYKAELLEVLVHQSQVLDLVPEEHREDVVPILHDALLAFMDGLSEDRLAERILAMSRIPPEAPRGDKILILASKIPTLQKLGQIVARMEEIPPDIRAALETLENQISTMSRAELVGYIRESVGRETIDRYRIRFDDKVLAEASVGAVIRGTFMPPEGGGPVDIVCKLIKPYAAEGLPRELKIIDGLIELAKAHGDFYNIGGMPLEDLFSDIKAGLAEEIRVAQEQANFRRAAAYYEDSKFVKIPRIYDFSTENITFMEFLQGEKITDAFRGDQVKRTALAKRLIRVMTHGALFSEHDIAIFHGDPHAGNVMHVTNDPERPYLIGLLDWGLMGAFDREHRMEMVQLSLALRRNSQKRLHRSVGALLRGGAPQDRAEQARLFKLADESLGEEGGIFEIYASLIERLTRAGFVLDPTFALFIKSQFTLSGIYRELDPDLDPDEYTEKLTRRRVMKEFPKRLLLLPAWNYRGYRSLMSNSEVFTELFN